MIKIIKTMNILGTDLSIYGDKQNPLFLAKDVAHWIKHSDVSKMCMNLDDDTEKQIRTLFVSGQNREFLFLTEYGVYEVLMTSRKKIAKELRSSLKAFLRAWRKQDVKVIANNLERGNNILLATKNLLEVANCHEDRLNSLEYRFQDCVKIETYQRGILQKTINKRVNIRYNELGEGVEKSKLYSAIHKELRLSLIHI